MADPVLHSPANPHFFKPLLPVFHSHLSIPLKFYSEHIEGRNERKTVELRSDACKKTWKVMMEGRRLTAGWKEFARAHDFKTEDIIIFRHEGDLVFHVTGFGPSFCEIQYDVQDNIRNSSTEQNLKTEPESSSSEQSCFVARVTVSNLRENRLVLPRRFVTSNSLKKGSNKIIITSDGVRRWTFDLLFRESSGTFYMRPGWRSFCHENGLELGDLVTFKLERNKRRTPLLRFFAAESKSVSTKHSSKRKRNTGETRFVTLKATPACLKYCRLYFPMRFTRVEGMEKAGVKKITLLDKLGVEWPVNLVIEKGKRMHLGSGLRDFLKATGVKANGSFTLELVWNDATIPPIFKFCSTI